MNTEHDADSKMKDEIAFAEETDEIPQGADRVPWKVLIVDDEEEVHTITRLALDGYHFEGRGLTFYSAYSGAEAKTIVQQKDDLAIILLDVVMETDTSGLEVVHYIREILKNKFVRIILRTGHPGQAPEHKIILECDINDYKEKTELTLQKLSTSVTTALRSYRDLRIIDKNRKGLEQIIRASAHLFEIQSLKSFAKGILTQLLSILDLDDSSLYVQSSGFTASGDEETMTILAATGEFANLIDKPANLVPPEVSKYLKQAIAEERSIFESNKYVGYFTSDGGEKNLLFLQGYRDLTALDKDLISIFSLNIATAFGNIYLNEEIQNTQKELIYTLGEVVENRSRETANHVRRVAEISYLLGVKYGLSNEDSAILRLASPMHDVGKVGIPDSILLKPGNLTPDEFKMIITHTIIGHKILKNSRRELMEAAAIVAQQHHERWDGTGYPLGLEGKDIHIFGRITGLADVFDALSHKRIYKEAFPIQRVIEIIKNERGSHFDPALVDIFIENIDEFIEINTMYPDR